jgi:hypothetical protein
MNKVPLIHYCCVICGKITKKKDMKTLSKYPQAYACLNCYKIKIKVKKRVKQQYIFIAGHPDDKESSKRIKHRSTFSETISEGKNPFAPLTLHNMSYTYFEQLPLDLFFPKEPENWIPLSKEELARKRLEKLARKLGKKDLLLLKEIAKLELTEEIHGVD